MTRIFRIKRFLGFLCAFIEPQISKIHYTNRLLRLGRTSQTEIPKNLLILKILVKKKPLSQVAFLLELLLNWILKVHQ